MKRKWTFYFSLIITFGFPEITKNKYNILFYVEKHLENYGKCYWLYDGEHWYVYTVSIYIISNNI